MARANKYYKTKNINSTLRLLDEGESIVLILQDNVDSQAAMRNLTSRMDSVGIKGKTHKVQFIMDNQVVSGIMLRVTGKTVKVNE